jgi:serine/threonine protein kinase
MPLQLEPGDKYETFEVLEVVHEYDGSSAYRCKAEGYDAIVRVRISLDPVLDQTAARRALRELEVLGELTNTHVTKMFDSGMGADDRWYMVLEDLEGAQLDEWHDFDRPMPAAQAVGLIHQACLGLAEVHARGVVHRDLKPDNLWVEPDGNLKIVDFASARGFGAHAVAGDNVTTQHVLVGTPQYAPPEQAYSSTLTTASDVYSLGVILYELLSGRCPFWADNPRSEIIRILADEPIGWMSAHGKKPVVSLRDQVPANLVDLLETCLAKKPEDRPKDAGVLANSLGWVLHHELGQAPVATLRVVDPSGAVAYRMVPPGAHRVGVGGGLDIRLRTEGNDEAWALLEWDGTSRPAELRVLDAAQTVTLNGQPMALRAAIGGGDQIGVGGFTLNLSYPRT